MALPVSLKAIVDDLDMLSGDMCLYINPKTGEVLLVPEYDCDEETEAKLAESEDFIEMPTQYDIDEYEIMQDFCESVENPTLRDDLLSAIRGRGAFRLFKHTIHREGIEQDWYRFRDQALEKIAIEFLEEHGIPYQRDTAKA